MPITHVIDPELGLAVLRFQGVLTVDDVADALDRCGESPDFRPDMDVLADLNHSTLAQSGFRDILHLARRLTPWYLRRSPAGRSVLWARSDVNFGIGRMYQSTVESRNPAQVGVFRTESEALDFLERDPLERMAIAEHLERTRRDFAG